MIAQDEPLGDLHNMLCSGCNIVYGRAEAVVTRTGMNIEMVKIANLLADEPDHCGTNVLGILYNSKTRKEL